MRIIMMARVVPLAALVSVGACGGGLGGALGDILLGGAGGPGGQEGVVTVEVREVRQAQRDIVVRTQDGQQGSIHYDQNTQVVYQNQQFPVTALELGDVVDMRVQQVQQGYYTDLIQVRTPVQERQEAGGTSPAQDVYRLEGTLGAIDTSRSIFELNMTQGGTLQVEVPANAPAATRDRLREYRTGDYVRVEVRPLDQQRAQLVRFGWS